MSDISARLRENADLDEMEHCNPDVVALEREAADTIDQLRTRIAELEEALGSIAKRCQESRSQTRRIRWIEQRATAALTGEPFKEHVYQMPKNGERTAEKVWRENVRLKAHIAELEAQQRAGVPEGIKVSEACIYKLNDRGYNEWFAQVQPGDKSDGTRLKQKECEHIALMLAGQAPAPKAQEHIPVDAGTTARIDAAVAAGRIVMPAPQPAEVGADERAKFEAWITSPPLEKPVHRNPESSGFPGQYWEYEVQLAWEAWQARAQLADGAEATGELHEYIAGMRAALRSSDWRKAGTRAELESMLSRMEAALTAAGGREVVDWPQQVFELCNFLAGHGWTMTKATHDAWMLSTGDANKYPNPLDALARMAIAATQPAKEKPE